MNRAAKIVVIILIVGFAGLGVVALASLFAAGQATSSVAEADEALQIAGQIAEFDIPEGYEPSFGIEAEGTKLAVFVNPDDPSDMEYWLLETKDQAQDIDSIAATIASLTTGGHVDATDVSLVAQGEVTVRGQPGLQVLREGPGPDEYGIRHAQLNFMGKGGPSVLLVVGRPYNWDQTEVDAVFGSVR